MSFLQKENSQIPVIVTNKHVVADAIVRKFHVTIANQKGIAFI